MPRSVGDEVRSGSFVVEGAGVVRGRSRRCRELRRADRRHGPRVPPSALAARALDRPAPLRPARRDGAARCDADRGAPQAGRRDPPRGRHGRRRDGDADPRGARSCSSRSPTRRPRCGWRAAGALSQQLNAIESLASVDTICVDKTGTLTTASLRLVELLPAAGDDRGGARRRPRPLRGRVGGAEPHAAGGRGRAARDLRACRRDGSRSSPGGAGAGSGSAAPATCSARRSSSRSGSSPRRPLAQQEAGRRVVGFGIADGAVPGRSRRRPAAAAAARPRRARRGAPAARRARRSRYLLEQGVDGRRPLGRRSRDGGLDRGRRRHPGGRPPARGRRACPPTTSSSTGSRASLSVVGRISPEGKRRVVDVAAPQRPLRGDGR